jgi:hypothetical protein
VYFLPSLLRNTNRQHLGDVAQGKFIPSLKEASSILLTFLLTVLAWVVFRSENIGHALQYITDLFKNPGSYLLLSNYTAHITIVNLILVLLIVEWLGRQSKHALEKIPFKRPTRYMVYCLIILIIFWYGGKEQQFIYFQF